MMRAPMTKNIRRIHPHNTSRQQQSGFSLIETVAVVTIAGSLTAVAAPKLTKLPVEARVAVVNHMAGAVQTASTLMHMQCAVKAPCDLDEGLFSLDVSGSVVQLSRGYPKGGGNLGIANALQFSGFTPRHSAGRTVFIKDGAPNADQCAVYYDEPSANGHAPTITALTSGC